MLRHRNSSFLSWLSVKHRSTHTPGGMQADISTQNYLQPQIEQKKIVSTKRRMTSKTLDGHITGEWDSIQPGKCLPGKHEDLSLDSQHLL